MVEVWKTLGMKKQNQPVLTCHGILNMTRVFWGLYSWKDGTVLCWTTSKTKPTTRSLLEIVERLKSYNLSILFVCLFVSYLFRVRHSTDMCSLLQENLLGGRKRVYQCHMYMYIERRWWKWNILGGVGGLAPRRHRCHGDKMAPKCSKWGSP